MLLIKYVQYVDYFPSSSNKTTKKKKKRKPQHVLTMATREELRICNNRTCRRQGSFQTLEIIRDLSPPNVTVNSCGCLGRCGAGPNVAFLPQGIIVGHCATAASAARLIAGLNNNNAIDDIAIRDALDALALRKRAEAEIDRANFSQAEILLSGAIHLKPFGGLHIMYKYRSLVRLAMENYMGALEDAREALKIAPQYPEVGRIFWLNFGGMELHPRRTKQRAYMCEGDAFMAMEQYDEAEKSYSLCLQIDPTIRRSKAFKSRVAKLLEKLMAVNMPHSQQ